jgi:hypothetical protein
MINVPDHLTVHVRRQGTNLTIAISAAELRQARWRVSAPLAAFGGHADVISPS